MTREQAKQKLISFGIEEPTDEQITDFLNTIGTETKKEKERADGYKTKADKADELQTQLDDLNSQNLSDIEKANAERDKALNSVTDLQNQIKTMQLKTGLAEQGIVGEQADKLIESLNGGSFDTALLGQIISEKNKTAIADYEKKNLDGTPNPDGGKGGKAKDEKPDDVKNAESITFGAQASEQSEKDYYVMK